MLQKVQIILKNNSNKNCLELNFLQKTQRTHFSISPRSGVMGLQRPKVQTVARFSTDYNI